MRNSLLAIGAAILMAIPCAAQQDPLEMGNASWITLNGTVVGTTADSFILDYGEGVITVEMDGWDWFGDAFGILENDRVRVRGRVDDDFYEATTIEASSVYVQDLNTYFYASPADEEDFAGLVGEGNWSLDITGTVKDVSFREITLDTGSGILTVDTIMMPYNPLDDAGFQKIRKGDRIKVFGDMDYDVFEKKELMADAIITLQKDEGKSNTPGG